MVKQLTDLQQGFAIAYVRNGGNAYQAAIDAGYNEAHAKQHSYSLLEIPLIQERINTIVQHKDSETLADYQWKIYKLKRVVEKFIPDDTELSAYDVRTGLQAIAELNKMMGHYAPDRKLTVNYDATKQKLKDVKKQYEEY